jgi:hypothetical protein
LSDRCFFFTATFRILAKRKEKKGVRAWLSGMMISMIPKFKHPDMKVIAITILTVAIVTAAAAAETVNFGTTEVGKLPSNWRGTR